MSRLVFLKKKFEVWKEDEVLKELFSHNGSNI